MPYQYTIQYALGITVTVVLVALGAIQATGGEALGLSDRTLAWFGIVSAALGAINGFLPRAQAKPSPERQHLD